MTGAVFAHGHWRRRNPLEGLSAGILAAVEDAHAEPLARSSDRGAWRAGLRARAHKAPTVAAAARRGLLRLRCDVEGQNCRYALTAAGLEVAAELVRRAKARAAIARTGRAAAAKAAP